MYIEKFSHSLIVRKPDRELALARRSRSHWLGRALSKFLTMCGRRILARLWIRAWLNPESSRNRASFCSSMILFSSSMFFRFFSMVEICRAKSTAGLPALTQRHPPPPMQGAWPWVWIHIQAHKPATAVSPWPLPSPSWTRSAHWSPCSAAWSLHHSPELQKRRAWAVSKGLRDKQKMLGFLLSPSYLVDATTHKHPLNGMHIPSAYFYIYIFSKVFSIRVQWCFIGQYVNTKANDSRAVGVQDLQPPCKADCPENSGHCVWFWVGEDAI